MSLRCRSLLFLTLLAVAAPALGNDAERARALLEARDPQAPALIASLLKQNPASLEARVLGIRLMLRDGKAEDAVKEAEKLVKAHPQSALAHYWLGNAYGNRIGQVGMFGKLSIAPKMRDAFETTLRLDPEHVDARANLIPFYLQAPAAIGGGIDKARAQQVEIAKRDVARGHLANAQILMSEEKHDEAFKAFQAAVAAKPGDRELRLTVGMAYQTLKRWDAAFALFEAMTAEDQAYGAAWYQLGRTSALSGQKLELGADALRHYLTLPADPRSPAAQHAWYRMGQVLATAGRKDEARQAYQSALKLDPKHSEAKAELAKL